MNNDILNKYAGYYIGTDLMGNSLPIKSWTFENEAEFQSALEQGNNIAEGSLIWIVADSAYYKFIKGELKQLYQYFDLNDYVKEEQLDELLSQKSQVQIITWGAND